MSQRKTTFSHTIRFLVIMNATRLLTKTTERVLHITKIKQIFQLRVDLFVGITYDLCYSYSYDFPYYCSHFWFSVFFIHACVTRVFTYDFQTFLSLASSLLAFHSSKSLITSPHVF